MNETVHIDLTPAEIHKITKVTAFLASRADVSVRRVKDKFNLTNAEYEIMMDLAMPLIREHGLARQWKRVYTNFLRKLEKLSVQPHTQPPGQRSVMSWNDDPTIRLERLEREIKATLDATFYSGNNVDAILQTLGYDTGDDESDREGGEPEW